IKIFPRYIDEGMRKIRMPSSAIGLKFGPKAATDANSKRSLMRSASVSMSEVKICRSAML
ncbi:MAG: hypothetical protein J6B44_09750, partial [Muribaculaceae bacterium]|nr:hypothetical protein [Muribaculaceae bacterium]